MRAVYMLTVLLIVFLVGGYVDHTYDWPFGLFDNRSAVPLPAGASSGGSTAPLPTYSRAQGAQDPPRAEAAAGASVDMQRCINTMIQRREPEQEARQVCQKIITGISGG